MFPDPGPLPGLGSLTMAFIAKFSLALVLKGRNGGLSFLCHGCCIIYQQWVLGTFPGPGCLRSENKVP